MQSLLLNLLVLALLVTASVFVYNAAVIGLLFILKLQFHGFNTTKLAFHNQTFQNPFDIFYRALVQGSSECLQIFF